MGFIIGFIVGATITHIVMKYPVQVGEIVMKITSKVGL